MTGPGQEKNTTKQSIPVEYLIRHWESCLQHDKWLMDPSTQVLIESTLGYLRQFKQEHPTEKADRKKFP